MSGGQFNNIDYVSFKVKTAANDSATVITAATDQSATGPFAISANTNATPSVFTSAAHGFLTGQTVTTSATNSTPAIDGTFKVTVLSATTFYVSLNGVPQGATVAGTAGSVVPTYTVVTAAGHGLTDNQSATIANESTATPALNGVHVVNVLDNDTFEIPIVTTAPGTDGDVSSEFGTTSQPQHICYYSANCLTITSTTIATPGVISTNVPHNLVTGDRIYITDSDSTPTLNGPRVVTVLSSTTFDVGVTTTGSGTTGQVCIEKYAVKEVFIDSYDSNGDPVYSGETLVNQRYNVAESRFEFIVRSQTVLGNLARIGGNSLMLPYLDSRFTNITQGGHTRLMSSTYRDVNNTDNLHWLNVATGTTLTIVSTSSEDFFGGQGIYSIFMFGLDDNLNLQVESVILNGTTPVVTTTTWRAINSTIATSGGNNGDGAIGKVSIVSVDDGTEWAAYLPGETTSEVGRYTVPAGHRVLVHHLLVNSGGGGDMTVRIPVQIGLGYQITFGELYIGSGIVNQLTGNYAFFIEAGYTIYFRGNSNSGNPFQRRMAVSFLGIEALTTAWDEYKIVP